LRISGREMDLRLLSIFLCYISLVYCFPEGAPKCDVDVPKHDSIKAKSGRAPYTIVATAPRGSSSTGQTVTVTITGIRGRTFKGFILSARAPNTRTNIGKFTASANTKTLECNASTNTITHTDSKDKSSVSFKWTAPKDYKGKVEFRFVLNFDL
jgi:hypothetical protein